MSSPTPTIPASSDSSESVTDAPATVVIDAVDQANPPSHPEACGCSSCTVHVSGSEHHDDCECGICCPD